MPSVHLVVDEGLTEWLVVRLLEDGYPLAASADDAQVQLSVTAVGDGRWTVTAVGTSTMAFEVEDSGDAAVTRLELLHRSLDALEDVEAEPPPQHAPATVALSVTDESPPEFAAEVVVDILAAGATLVPAGAPAELRVCADRTPGEDASRISVIDGDADCTTTAEPGVSVFNAVHFASTTQRVEAAIAELRQPPPAQDATPAPTPEPRARPEPIEPGEDSERAPGLVAERRRVLTPDGRSPRIVRGGVGAGAFGRLTTVDPVIFGALTFGREPGIQGLMELHVRPSNVTGSLLVSEVFPALGLLARPVTVKFVSFIAGGMLGPEFHRYQLRAGDNSGAGLDVGLSAEFLFGVSFAFKDLHEIQFAFRTGGGRQRTHAFEGEDIWARHALRIGATVSILLGRRVRA